MAAYIRRCGVEGVPCMLRRRGAPEAGAIFVKVDRLDGTAVLYGPAPQSLSDDDGERLFLRLHAADCIDAADAEARLQKELRFDSDLWLAEVEDRQGRHFLPLAKDS